MVAITTETALDPRVSATGVGLVSTVLGITVRTSTTVPGWENVLGQTCAAVCKVFWLVFSLLSKLYLICTQCI